MEVKHGVEGRKKEALKMLIRRLHEGEDLEKVKRDFRAYIGTVTSEEIARIEEDLIKEGTPREEIQRLCDIHLSLFRESLERERISAPHGHPIRILMDEHEALIKIGQELKNIAEKLAKEKGFDSASGDIDELNIVLGHLRESERHYLREENVLFPYLEKHGITQPPAIMWTEHNKIREIEKDIHKTFEERENLAFREFTGNLMKSILALAEIFLSHFYKENNILFPTAQNVIIPDEWVEIRRQFDEIGYCSFTPEDAQVPFKGIVPAVLRAEAEGAITFETGSMSREELEAVLNTLPFDITFVDKDDTVRYYSQGRERIFVRTKAVIGRKVQQCHPQKSIHIVNRILQAFKDGSKDVAEFWINLKDRLIYIRYFAVRDRDKKYLGCLEVVQDITSIKKIEGEKRLLDWT